MYDLFFNYGITVPKTRSSIKILLFFAVNPVKLNSNKTKLPT